MVDKKKIMELLKKYFETRLKVTVDGDGLVSCTGSVNLKAIPISHLPVRFKSVDGYFLCSNNSLKSLKGAPSSVGGDFYCYDNKLTTLAGAPQSVGDDFYCQG